MIHANRIVTVGEQECIIDRPIVLYRGDREVEIEFTLVGNEFMFSEEGNVIKTVNASHGQLVLNTPSGEHMFSELAECHEGKVVFVVTKEMIDEFIEMGFYSFQIRLYDSAEMKSRVTIPPVMNGFDIRNPIAAEDETNVVDQGIVDYARIFKDQSNEELPTFDWMGNYNKTEWAHHDLITENKMNKIEDALYSINANIKESDVVMLNTLDKVKKDADKYVKEHMAEVEADVDEFERNLNTDVEKFKIDTNASMTAHKNEVSEELESVNSQLEHIAIKIRERYLDETDDTTRLQEAINEANNSSTILISEDYIVSTLRLKDNIILKGNGGSIKWKDNTCIDESIPYYFINGMNVNNVTIDGVKIIGNQANNTKYQVADSITIGGENNKVINCTILDSADSGIMFSGCKNSEISGNRIDNCKDLGIYVNDGTGENHYENIISNNKITNCVHGGIGCKRIVQRTIINSNTIYNCGNGITLENASTATDFSKNITITNNTLRRIGFEFAEAAKRGINLRCSHNTIVSNNKIEEVERQGIFIEGSDNCSVQNNIIIGSDEASVEYNWGISLSDRNNQGCNYNIIQGNIVTNTQNIGMYIRTTIESKYNIIKDNIINNLNATAFRTENKLSESIIQGNVFNGEYDYIDYGASNCIISDNKLVNNKPSGNFDSRNRNMIATTLGGNGISYSMVGMPSSGYWYKEDIVYNMKTSFQGTGAGKYYVLGWKRLTTGEGHIIGTDWQEIKIYVEDRIKYESRISDIGKPTGIFTPYYLGEEIIDTNNKIIYKAIGLTKDDWVEIATYK